MQVALPELLETGPAEEPRLRPELERLEQAPRCRPVEEPISRGFRTAASRETRETIVVGRWSRRRRVLCEGTRSATELRRWDGFWGREGGSASRL